MTLYTIQHMAVYEHLKKHGTFVANPEYILFEDFRKGYKWMMSQVKIKYPKWVCEHPIWVWTERPDLRKWVREVDDVAPHVKEMVLIEFNVPDQDVLLSNFDLWHFVLNGHEIPYKGVKAKTMEESWERIFLTTPEQLAPVIEEIGDISYKVQGLVEKIDMSQIVSIKPFKTKVRALKYKS